jgi:cytochrome c oxidase assembly factor CtaG
MVVDPGPLTLAALIRTWHLDVSSATAIVLLASAYAWCSRRARDRGQPTEPAQLWVFVLGVVLWALATISAIGAYAYILFWMRALQVLLLLYLVPFFLAQCAEPSRSRPNRSSVGISGGAGPHAPDYHVA